MNQATTKSGGKATGNDNKKGRNDTPLCHSEEVPDQPEIRTIFLLRKPGCTAIVKISRQGSVVPAIKFTPVIYTGEFTQGMDWGKMAEKGTQ